MSNATPGNHKHLTLDNRIVIEKSLDRGATLKSIAKELDEIYSSKSGKIEASAAAMLKDGE